MLRCGDCGEAMVPRTNPNRRIGPSEVYYCYGRKQRGTDACPMPPIARSLVDSAVYDYFERVGLDVEATREQVAAAVHERLTQIRQLREQAELEAASIAESLSRIRADYRRGAIRAEDWADLRGELDDSRRAAAAQVDRLVEQEGRAREVAITADAENETIRRLSEIRAAIAGEVTDARGTDAVRAAICRLFDEFTLHRWESSKTPRFVITDLAVVDQTGVSFAIEPRVRPEVVDGWHGRQVDRHAEGYPRVRVNPVLKRVPVPVNKVGDPLVT
jgi:Recombinase zinc beta ribbon domain